jgi:hypothetical protein
MSTATTTTRHPVLGDESVRLECLGEVWLVRRHGVWVSLATRTDTSPWQLDNREEAESAAHAKRLVKSWVRQIKREAGI